MAVKNILFISHDGMTDPLGQSQVIPYLGGLTRFGYTFTILSCDKPAKYAANKAYVEQLIAPFPIQWVSLPYHKKPAVLSSLFDFYALRKTAKKLHAQQPFDMVHSRPGLPSLVALYMKRKFGLKFLNDIRGFWAEERIDGGIWNLNNPVLNQAYHFFKRHEYQCLLNADYNVCLTYKAREELLSRADIPNQPLSIEVIPCSVDMQLFNQATIDKESKATFKAELKINDNDFIISYLGSLGGWYLTNEMMRFCKSVSIKIPHAKFLFISPNSYEMIAAAATSCGLSSNQLIVRQGKRHEVPVLLSLSNFSVFFIKPCFSKLASSPTKHGEIMAMGIPLITNSGVGDVAEIVTKSDSGYILTDFTESSFNQVIDKMVSGKQFDQHKIREAAAEYYKLESAVDRYKKVYDRIFTNQVQYN